MSVKKFIAQEDEECYYCGSELPKGSIIWTNESVTSNIMCDECYHDLKEEL